MFYDNYRVVYRLTLLIVQYTTWHFIQKYILDDTARQVRLSTKAIEVSLYLALACTWWPLLLFTEALHWCMIKLGTLQPLFSGSRLPSTLGETVLVYDM